MALLAALILELEQVLGYYFEQAAVAGEVVGCCLGTWVEEASAEGCCCGKLGLLSLPGCH